MFPCAWAFSDWSSSVRILYARITASTPLGAPAAGMAGVSTTLVRSSGLTLIVSTTLGDGDGDAGTSPGDLVEHEMTITNEGTVTLINVSVEDSLLSIADDQ